MRLSSMTPIALAALIGGVLPHPALANPTSDSLAVPVSPATPTAATTRTQSPSQGLAVPTTPNATATPETRSTPEFSQRANVPTLSSNPNDVVVRATRVSIVGASQELQEIARQSIATKEGGDTNQQQLQRDVATLLETGLFNTVRVNSQANRDGLDVTFAVEPTIVRSLQLNNAKVLTPEIANSFFSDSIGKPVSPAVIKQGLTQIERWYQDNGYVLARVTDAHPTRDGSIKVTVAEGTISNIDIRFIDDKGQPTDGRTQQDYIRKGLKLQPGEIFRIDTAREDLRQLYQLGLFKNANIKLEDTNNQQVNVAYLLSESPSRGFDAGGGYSDSAGLFGSVRYNDQNFGGVNNQLNVNATVGTRDVQFNANYGKPYRASRPDEVGYNVNAFRGSGTSTALEDSTLANGDTPRERRIGAGVTVTKPIDDWNASVGLNYTRTSIRDGNGKVTPVDANGKPLSFSDSGVDDLVTVRAAVGQDRRDNPANPTSGSVVNFSTEQSLPIGSGSILMNRLEAKYSQYVPLSVFQGKNPEVLAFNVQGGTTLGDLPPYQAFTLGGANSVRGYGNGDLATSRSYVLATAEYRVPLFDSPVSGVLFADFGSDLGSSSSVPGEPGSSKPGTGFGYGAGVRVNSPVGMIRADYGISDRGDSRVQFGLGQRF